MKKKSFKLEKKLLLISAFLIPISFLLVAISLNNSILITKEIALIILCSSVILFLGISFKRFLLFKFGKRNIQFKLGSVLLCLIGTFLISFGLIYTLYNQNSNFKSWWIKNAMNTLNYQYLANWFYSQDTIMKVLENDSFKDQIQYSSSSLDAFEVSINTNSYKDEYEKELLEHNEGDVYKILEISGVNPGTNYKYSGFLVAIYDPSKVKLGVSVGAGMTDGSFGQTLGTIVNNNDALLGINAGGFYDPMWVSNGGIPHGLVIKDGKLLTEFRRGTSNGGLIGFNSENELVLKRMNGPQAVDAGIRDAIDWGPYLIVDGVNKMTNSTNGWMFARSAIAQRKDGTVLFLIIDGLQSHSKGITFEEMSNILLRYGAYNAANLDGGTSTALYVNGEYKNIPFNGSRRTIRYLPNAWIVVK